MSARYVRFFSSPEAFAEGTVVSYGFQAATDKITKTVNHILYGAGFKTIEILRDDYLLRDEEGLRLSDLEILVQPRMDTEQIRQLGAAICQTEHGMDYLDYGEQAPTLLPAAYRHRYEIADEVKLTKIKTIVAVICYQAVMSKKTDMDLQEVG